MYHKNSFAKNDEFWVSSLNFWWKNQRSLKTRKFSTCILLVSSLVLEIRELEHVEHRGMHIFAKGSPFGIRAFEHQKRESQTELDPSQPSKIPHKHLHFWMCSFILQNKGYIGSIIANKKYFFDLISFFFRNFVAFSRPLKK